MYELPLAAQAVWSAYEAILEYECTVTKTDMKALAAALRAAADQILPPDDDPEFFPGNCCERVLKQEQEETRYALLAIATSFEAQ